MKVEEAIVRAFELVNSGLERADLKAQQFEEVKGASCLNWKVSAYAVGATVRIDASPH